MNKDEREYIDFIIGNSNFLSYNTAMNSFEIKEYNLSWEEFTSLHEPIERMRHTIPPEGFFRTNVKDINLGFYDKCLEDYCSDRLEKNISIKDTDLVSKGNKVIIFGRVLSDSEFTLDSKTVFLDSLKSTKDQLSSSIYRHYQKNNSFIQNISITDEGWVKAFLDYPIVYNNDIKSKLQYLRERIKKTIGYYSEDRVLGVINNIRQVGWDESLTWRPHIGSQLIQGSIIGISSKSQTNSLITGRHRITAALYLHKRGEIKEQLIFDYPRITYPWKTWVHDNL